MDEKKNPHEMILTPLGAKIILARPLQRFTSGLLFQIAMQDTSDRRWTEVDLDQQALDELIKALEKFRV